MDFLSLLLSWQFLTLGFASYCIIFIARTIAEYFYPTVKDARFWRDLFLPLAPIMVAALLAGLLRDFPFPAPLLGFSSRAAYGAVAGLFSGLLYRVLAAKLRGAAEQGSEPPSIERGLPMQRSEPQEPQEPSGQL